MGFVSYLLYVHIIFVAYYDPSPGYSSLAGVVGQVWPIQSVCSCVKNFTVLVYPLCG